MKKKIIVLTGCILAACLISSYTYSQEKSKTVLIIPIKYENNEWKYNPEEVVILPCEPPSLPMKGTKQDPAIQLLGRGKVILEYHIMDPRIFLPEDYKEEYKLLDKVDFTIRLALNKGVDEFRFYYKPGEDLNKVKPTISIDLKRYIEAYNQKGGEKQKAPCQEEEYVPDQRPKK